MIDLKFDIHFKNIKNMRFNNQIFKICGHFNLFNKLQPQDTIKFVTKFCP